MLHNARSLADLRPRRGGRLHLQLLYVLVFLRASRAFTIDLRGSGADGKRRIRHTHHLVGDAICLMFERIIDLSDRELRLYDAWQRRYGEQRERLGSVRPIMRKYGDVAEIPRCDRCRRSKPFSLLLMLVTTLIPGQTSRPLREK